MRTARWAWLGIVAVAACHKPETQRHDVAPATSAGAASVVLTATSEVDSAGLHVLSGTLSSLVARRSEVTPSAQPATPSALWGFTDIGLDATRTRLQLVLAKHGAPLAQLLPPNGLAVVNGGYFEPDFRPSTWLKDAGVELSPKSDTSKGGVLALGSGGTFIGPFAELRFEPELALQSFPLIVEAGGKAGIHGDDGRRAARTVACLVGDQLHFIVIAAPRGDGPTLFESAALLREPAPRGFGCSVALNLDGGPSTGVWFAPQINARQRAPFGNVGYAVAIVPR